MVTSKPSNCPIGASAWLMCTAPVITSLRRRHVDGQEDAPLRRFFHAALGHAEALFDQVAQRILGHVGGLDQPLRAACHVGDEHHRAARFAFGIERVQDVEFHLATFST